MWQGVTKKLLKWEKTYFFISSSFCQFFYEKVNFCISPARRCRRCGKFDIGFVICVWWLAISMARSFKYFQNYLTHLTNFKHFVSSTCIHVHNQSHDTYGQHEAGDWIWTCEHVEDPNCLKFVRCFCCYSASELLQLKLGKKKCFREMRIAQPPTQL